jgi:hypothetical protein
MVDLAETFSLFELTHYDSGGWRARRLLYVI